MFCAVCIITVVFVILYVAYDVISRIPQLPDVAKRAVFITGCDSGFGAALSRRLDRLGVPVFAGCLTEGGAAKLRDETSTRLTTIMLDVTNTDNIMAAFNSVKESLNAGKVLWGVVNNAGIATTCAPLDFLTRQDFSNIFNINVFSMAEVSRIFLPLLKQSRGRIVNMTSIAGVQATAFDISYSASKYAAEGLSDALRRSLWIWGISVHIIEPTFYKTGILNKDFYINKVQAQWDCLPTTLKEEYGDEYLQKTFETIDAVVNIANPNLDEVVDAYQHALLACRPRLHYPVGTMGKLIYALSILPTALNDAIYRRSLQLPLPNALLHK